ncbi:MAG TPA: stage II sporulation protein P [Firmicutes bacterium]|nr:stage II sporulation protein P [Bacillota bacterium]
MKKSTTDRITNSMTVNRIAGKYIYLPVYLPAAAAVLAVSIFLSMGIILCLHASAGAAVPMTPLGEEWGERRDGGYYRIVNLEGQFLTTTALDIDVDDVFIAEDNERWIIDRIDGDTAYARSDGKEKMPTIFNNSPGLAGMAWQWAAQLVSSARRQNGEKKVIGIFQTHNDESYLPTSGEESETPQGDIHEVGLALKESLEKQGYTVVYSDNIHLPHDGQAYLRSRRTAAELSKDRPTTIIDVHRDAVPNAASYRTTINGEQVAKVRIVVGRQNPNKAMNLNYAKRLKAAMDERFPGLSRGIFMAKGNYNQDLGPRMILLEFGTHTLSLDEAKKAAALVGEVLPAAAGMAPGTGASAQSQMGSAAMNTVAWLLGLSVVGGGIWYFLNKEGFWRRRRN